MYATNMEHYGHLKDLSTFTTKQKHNDMYQIIENRIDWEEKYLHPEYRYYLTEVNKCRVIQNSDPISRAKIKSAYEIKYNLPYWTTFRPTKLPKI